MNNFNNKAHSLILCSNPLQIMIAEKIIAINSDKHFDLLVASSFVSNNDKYYYYYNKIAIKCNDRLLYNVTSGIKNFIKFKKLLKSHNLNKSYSEIYVASIDVRIFQYIVSKNPKAEIYTFDDGLANIITTSIYYKGIKESALRRYVWRFLGVKVGVHDIRNHSKLHFTIYKDQPNIINNTKFIPLIDSLNENCVKNRKVLKFFLGQPIKSISEKYNKEYITSVLEKLDIDNYYPHPKESKIDIPSDECLNIIRSELVFEDYIIELLKSNSSLEVEVYSFLSSCIVNLSSIKRVKVLYVHDNLLYNKYKYFYTYARNSLKIPHVSIEV